MAQHALISLAAAPLLVLGAPLALLLWGLPAAWRAPLTSLGGRWLRALWRALTALPVATGLYVVVFWLWHVPALYEAALHSPALHALAHGSYLGAAVLFWWAVGLGGGRASSLAGIAALFVAGLQNSALSALILSARAPWFADHARNALLCNLAPLEDQRLAGLIMMLPCDLVYLGAAMGLGAAWLRGLERRARPGASMRASAASDDRRPTTEEQATSDRRLSVVGRRDSKRTSGRAYECDAARSGCAGCWPSPPSRPAARTRAGWPCRR